VTRASEQDEGMNKFLKMLTMISVEDSVAGLLHEIDNGTRETRGGQFVDFNGVRLKW